MSWPVRIATLSKGGVVPPYGYSWLTLNGQFLTLNGQRLMMKVQS